MGVRAAAGEEGQLLRRAGLSLLAVALAALASCDEPSGPAPVAADGPAVATPAAAPTPAAVAWLPPRRLLFLHRSVGIALIRNGAVDMYDVLARLNDGHRTSVEMWHHGCGTDPYWNRYWDGLDEQVVPNFGPALSEPLYGSPEHWRLIFCDAAPQYAAARDSIDNFRVIAFKSGYDNTVQYAAELAGQWRQDYRAIRDSGIVADPARRTVVLGFPPNREGLGDATQADADSSRAFNTWLVEEFVRGRPNLYGFPLFDRLAGADNWLRDEYELVQYPYDAHPNALGCEVVGGELMAFLHAVATKGGRPWKVTEHPHQEPAE